MLHELVEMSAGVDGALCVIDPAGRIQLANPEAERVLGVGREELVGTPLWEVLPQPAALAMRGAAEAALADARRRTVDGPLELSDRSFRATVTRVSRGLVVHLVDVTEHEHSRARARLQEESLDGLLTSWGLVVAFADRDLRYRQVYNVHEDFDPDACLGMRDYEIDDNAGTQALAGLKREVVETGRSIRREISFPLSGGKRTYLFHAEPVLDPRGAISGAKTVALDITDLRRAEAEAATDHLTGAANRRSMETLVRQEVSRTRRYGTLSSLIAIDIDHFKRVNDRHGHIVGDAIIKAVVECLRAELRSADSVARWGGEEFLVLLPETEHEEAVRVAERMRQRVATHAFGEVDHVAISLGVATARIGDRVRDLLARADAALYRAKREGRNRVVADRDHAEAAEGAPAPREPRAV
jgi:diguanylate cyclase (GGDEF)-like protein/PAS domain S-box-containing protein